MKVLRTKTKILTIVLLLIGTAVIGVWLRLMPAVLAEHPTTHPEPIPQNPNQRMLSRDKVIEGESITITPRGFEPNEIRRSNGFFLLNINNRSTIRNLSLSLRRETGGTFREVKIREQKLNWRGIVKLEPGRYKLIEANHPDWGCEIVISP